MAERPSDFEIAKAFAGRSITSVGLAAGALYRPEEDGADLGPALDRLAEAIRLTTLDVDFCPTADEADLVLSILELVQAVHRALPTTLD